MKFIIGISNTLGYIGLLMWVGVFLQYRHDIIAKIKSAVDWVKGLFNRD